MKKDTKKKGNKKLVSALAMFMLSGAMLGTSTYAWFTMNKKVEVTGMELKTKVGTNLLICSDNVEANYSSATLVQGRKALLEPVSSINGTTGSFYYTVNATARGTKMADGVTVTQYNESVALENITAGKNKYDKTFNATYGNSETGGTGGTFSSGTVAMTNSQLGAAYGYVDYVFYLKGTSDSATQDLNMTECNIIYNDKDGNESIIGSGTKAGEDIDRAWRIGVFVTDITANGGAGHSTVSSIDPAAAADVDDNQKAILGLANSAYFTDVKAQASTTANGLGDVVNFKNGGPGATGVVLDTISGIGTTKYYKVLVRVWLEGEDDTCNSATYAALQTGKWTLDCRFELGEGTPITALHTSTASADRASSGTVQTSVTDVDVDH